MYLLPYKMGSQGGKALSQALGIKRIKKERSRFKGSANKTVINWGNGSLPDEVVKCRVINNPAAVNKAGNKLLAFKALAENEDINIPEFTEDKEQAATWPLVVCRTVLRGHSGEGIVLASPEEEDLVDAPLYVKYVKKTQEYRVHAAFGEVVDQQRKARNRDVPDENVNWKVRNHTNGFIFMREGVDLPEVALEQAKMAVRTLGLHFGAVDLIYNEREDKYYVLEINTAPGLTGTTLTNYVEVFSEYVPHI